MHRIESTRFHKCAFFLHDIPVRYIERVVISIFLSCQCKEGLGVELTKPLFSATFLSVSSPLITCRLQVRNKTSRHPEHSWRRVVLFPTSLHRTSHHSHHTGTKVRGQPAAECSQIVISLKDSGRSSSTSSG
jgi:hypothetical protein